MINLIQPLPFFDRLTEQERFKENCDGMYSFLSKNDQLIPFQISVPFLSTTIDHIKIKGFNCEYEAEIDTNSDKFKFITSGERRWLIYKGEQLTFTRENGATEPLKLAPDFYYFEVSIDGVPKYSEIFHVPGSGICEQSINMEIEAWDTKNTNGRTFDDGFRFKTFFNSFITNVTPDITEEFTKDGYERQIPLRKVVVFNYNIEVDPIPNSVSIGIAYITTLPNIVIRHNGNEYHVRDISYKSDRVEGGALESVQLTFSIFEQDIIKTSC